MITMEDIIEEGHPTLREIAKEIPLPASDEDKKTLTKMMEFLKMSQDDELAQKYNLRPGVGIAAPQINIPKRMIAVLASDEKGNEHEYAMINPKIISHSVEKAYLKGGEGCLSVNRTVPGYVPRYARIRVKATSLQGEPIDIRLKGYIAIVVQHEIDHLNGVMFYDHINQENPFHEPENANAIE
ncbi:peptide deformylase [Bacillus carboniphilus]|uniref:Peptide deformylase n=1 Tax=Bacillus carboniphilus TaxID=86663 RepID=A0ABY9JXX0_9BACI|nr:peptide deformylase [Bacillus carboniphilus]WLR43290.1 peptide deformylase [Bacillus carboniphilus]